MYCFQIYSIVPLHIDYDDGQPPETGVYADIDRLRRLLRYLGHDGLSDAQRPYPAYDIYQAQPDALACVEHQKCEIAYRKARKDDEATFLIPTFARRWDLDMGRTGFIVVLTSDRCMADDRPYGQTFDPQGPLWVRFDRRFASPSPAEAEVDLPSVHDGTGMNNPDAELPEGLEIEVERKLNTGDMDHHLKWMYFGSHDHFDSPPSE
ncbi:hypothetical protein LTR36_000059 [Oleoguttula mirabilis]|uniref:Uncharacterized protein n=1 Tax=Oleoguttula mirabilis TaxID=1507867 RepID=A0AAV9JXR8_9PEZI|nr:hypothetical protein LTR36_000059 [Oleoguttula mirabilis]